jgi:hypothetical protein
MPKRNFLTKSQNDSTPFIMANPQFAQLHLRIKGLLLVVKTIKRLLVVDELKPMLLKKCLASLRFFLPGMFINKKLKRQRPMTHGTNF